MQTSSTYEPILDELARVEENLKGLSHLPFSFLAGLLDHVLDSSGKRIRPAITLLASKFHPHQGGLPITMATAVELLHIAPLIHDDTVDNSDMRRGRATISSVWGRNIAVLLGDYVFAASATFVCDTNNVRVIRRFSETIMELSSGELAELVGTYNWQQTREQYWQRIYEKTASLFSTAAETGAVLSGAPEEVAQGLKAYGHNLGMAFQVVDDILDFQGTEEEIGKPVGNDLLQGVMTLPAILLMEQYPKDNPIPALFQNVEPDGNLRRAVDMIRNSSIIQDSYKVAQDLCDKAVQAIKELPETQPHQSLIEVVSYVLERRK